MTPPSPSRSRPDSGGHRDLFPFLALLDADPHIRLGGHRSQLPLQLSVTLKPTAIEGAVSQRALDRASRLGHVRAVREPAQKRELLDVLEQVAQRVFAFPQLRLTQSRRVDDHPALRELNELPMTRHVPPLARGVDGARAHEVMPTIRLINVDLPAPDGPRRTPVRAGWSSRRI